MKAEASGESFGSSWVIERMPHFFDRYSIENFVVLVDAQVEYDVVPVIVRIQRVKTKERGRLRGSEFSSADVNRSGRHALPCILRLPLRFHDR